ncbi:hypothetical protein [Methanococcus maripaludis]|uniref:Uncharacterized protein n=1 Tax=Methanococcus maripaludis TaxID=39152 RepID=A0A2L1C8I3_METMI|nr:hypothetical protein [Methanococcus maripaludis]AVB75647.1 hypothetical protein MMJJ_02280 [Methanococcus maripaludis]
MAIRSGETHYDSDGNAYRVSGSTATKIGDSSGAKYKTSSINVKAGSNGSSSKSNSSSSNSTSIESIKKDLASGKRSTGANSNVATANGKVFQNLKNKYGLDKAKELYNSYKRNILTAKQELENEQNAKIQKVIEKRYSKIGTSGKNYKSSINEVILDKEGNIVALRNKKSGQIVAGSGVAYGGQAEKNYKKWGLSKQLDNAIDNVNNKRENQYNQDLKFTNSITITPSMHQIEKDGKLYIYDHNEDGTFSTYIINKNQSRYNNGTIEFTDNAILENAGEYQKDYTKLNDILNERYTSGNEYTGRISLFDIAKEQGVSLQIDQQGDKTVLYDSTGTIYGIYNSDDIEIKGLNIYTKNDDYIYSSSKLETEGFVNPVTKEEMKYYVNNKGEKLIINKKDENTYKYQDDMEPVEKLKQLEMDIISNPKETIKRGVSYLGDKFNINSKYTDVANKGVNYLNVFGTEDVGQIEGKIRNIDTKDTVTTRGLNTVGGIAVGLTDLTVGTGYAIYKDSKNNRKNNVVLTQKDRYLGNAGSSILSTHGKTMAVGMVQPVKNLIVDRDFSIENTLGTALLVAPVLKGAGKVGKSAIAKSPKPVFEIAIGKNIAGKTNYFGVKTGVKTSSKIKINTLEVGTKSKTGFNQLAKENIKVDKNSISFDDGIKSDLVIKSTKERTVKTNDKITNVKNVVDTEGNKLSKKVDISKTNEGYKIVGNVAKNDKFINYNVETGKNFINRDFYNSNKYGTRYNFNNVKILKDKSKLYEKSDLNSNKHIDLKKIKNKEYMKENYQEVKFEENKNIKGDFSHNKNSNLYLENLSGKKIVVRGNKGFIKNGKSKSINNIIQMGEKYHLNEITGTKYGAFKKLTRNNKVYQQKKTVKSDNHLNINDIRNNKIKPVGEIEITEFGTNEGLKGNNIINLGENTGYVSEIQINGVGLSKHNFNTPMKKNGFIKRDGFKKTNQKIYEWKENGQGTKIINEEIIQNRNFALKSQKRNSNTIKFNIKNQIIEKEVSKSPKAPKTSLNKTFKETKPISKSKQTIQVSKTNKNKINTKITTKTKTRTPTLIKSKKNIKSINNNLKIKNPMKKLNPKGKKIKNPNNLKYPIGMGTMGIGVNLGLNSKNRQKNLAKPFLNTKANNLRKQKVSDIQRMKVGTTSPQIQRLKTDTIQISDIGSLGGVLIDRIDPVDVPIIKSISRSDTNPISTKGNSKRKNNKIRKTQKEIKNIKKWNIGGFGSAFLK